MVPVFGFRAYNLHPLHPSIYIRSPSLLSASSSTTETTTTTSRRVSNFSITRNRTNKRATILRNEAINSINPNGPLPFPLVHRHRMPSLFYIFLSIYLSLNFGLGLGFSPSLPFLVPLFSPSLSFCSASKPSSK
jgi:hypothetical protein